MLLDFAERVARQLVDNDEGTRDFEGREFFPAPGFQIRRIDVARCHHIRDRDFAPHAIGRGRHRSLGHAVLLLEELLDLPGIDVEAA